MSSPFGNSNTNFGQPLPNTPPSQNAPSTSPFGSDFGHHVSHAPHSFHQQPAPTSSASTPFGVSTPDTSLDFAPPAAAAVAVTSPWVFVSAAALAAFLGLLCGIVAPIVGGSATDSGFRTFAIMGWVLSGIIAFVLVGVHKVVDNKRKSAAVYLENSTHGVVARVTLAAGALGVVITAVEISLWVSKVL